MGRRSLALNRAAGGQGEVNGVSYNEAVRKRFADPQYAGDLEGSFDGTLTADVSASEAGAHIVISAGIRDGVIAAMVFRAWGCPHLIAAADLACEQLQGQAAGRLEDRDLADITRELAVPAEKAGRILLLEDALAKLWAQYGAGKT